jgi:hypothetical protein
VPCRLRRLRDEFVIYRSHPLDSIRLRGWPFQFANFAHPCGIAALAGLNAIHMASARFRYRVPRRHPGALCD